MASVKIVQYWGALSSYVQNNSTTLTLDVQFQTNTPTFPNDNYSIKKKHNSWMTIICWSFLRVCFRFRYELINLVWLSIDFFSFSWSQTLPQSNFKKSKNLFFVFLL